MPYLPLDIAPDLRLTIGNSSVQVTPRHGLRLAESLIRVSTRAIVREEAEREANRMVRVSVARKAKRS